MSQLNSSSSSQSTSPLSLHGTGKDYIHLSIPLCIRQVICEQTLMSDSKCHLYWVPHSCKDMGTGSCRQGCRKKKSLFQSMTYWLQKSTNLTSEDGGRFLAPICQMSFEYVLFPGHVEEVVMKTKAEMSRHILQSHGSQHQTHSL